MCAEKLKKKFGPLGGKVIRANIQRDAGSLGLALAGCRDRTKMGCFVAGINPKGMASSQNVKVGDEILEVIRENIKRDLDRGTIEYLIFLFTQYD